MNVIAIVQARTGSTRFPNKVFANLVGKPLIWHVINRLKYSTKIANIVLATTENQKDNKLEQWAVKEGIDFYRGSENNVLERFYYAAKCFSADIIVRITADDPFKDPQLIDLVIQKLIDENLDFAYNNKPPTFPEGLDTEVFTFNSLESAYLNAKDDFEKEHVTQYLYRNISIFKQANFMNSTDYSYLRWTIDNQLDYIMVKQIYENLYIEKEIFYMNDILNFLKRNPKISQMNKSIKRSDMYK